MLNNGLLLYDDDGVHRLVGSNMGQVLSDFEETATKFKKPGLFSRQASEDEEDEDVLWCRPTEEEKPAKPAPWGAQALWKRLSQEVLGQQCTSGAGRDTWNQEETEHRWKRRGLWRSRTEETLGEHWTTLGLLRRKSEEVLGENWPPHKMFWRQSDEALNSDWDDIWKREKTLVPEDGYKPGYTRRRRIVRRQSEADLKKRWENEEYYGWAYPGPKGNKAEDDLDDIYLNNVDGMQAVRSLSRKGSEEDLGTPKKWVMGSRRQSEETLYKKQTMEQIWGDEDDEVFGRDQRWKKRKRLPRSQTIETLGDRYIDHGLKRLQSEEVLCQRWGDEDDLWCRHDEEEVFTNGGMPKDPNWWTGSQDIKDEKLAEWMWIREDLWRRTGTRWTWTLRNGGKLYILHD